MNFLEGKTIIIVPCYNEEKNICKVIKELKEELDNQNVEFLFINDNSSDNTEIILKETKINFLSLPINMGYNYAVQTGLKFGLKKVYDNYILMDADEQHLASEIKKLITNFNNNIDIVIGSRFSSMFKSTYKIPFIRKSGMIFFSFLTSIFVRKKIKDTSSGFQIFNQKVAKALVYIYETKYPDAEVIILLKLLGFRIKEIPVRMKERKDGESMISNFYYPIRALLGIILATGRYFFLKKKVINV